MAKGLLYCKIFFFQSDGWKEIEKHLEKLPEPYQIITNNYLLNEHLKKINKKSRSIKEIFPEEGEITYDAYRRTMKLLLKYEKIFKENNIRFQDFEIFSGFQNQLLDQLILFERARTILEEKKSTVFIFEDYYFTYFAIAKLAKELGYVVWNKISLINGSRIRLISPDFGNFLLDSLNKYYYLKSIYFPNFSIKGVFDVNRKNFFTKCNRVKEILSKKIDYYKTKLKVAKNNHELTISNILGSIRQLFKNELTKKESVVIKVILFLSKILFYRSMSILKINAVKLILNSVNAKILNTNVKYDAECILVFTTNPEDTYLKSLYLILDKFRKENIKFQIFVIDIVTSVVLSKKNITYVNLFEEISSLSEVVKLSHVARIISDEIKEVALKENLSLLFTEGLNPQLIREVHRSIAIITIFNKIIQRTKPKSIVVATDGSMYGNSVINVAKKYDTPSFFVPSIHTNLNPIHANFYKADKICVHGKLGKEVLVKLGYSEKRLILTGNPRYDYIKNISKERSRRKLENVCEIDIDKKLIVIAMARWHDNDEVWMSEFIKFCNNNNIEIAIKIHPTYKSPSWYPESEEKIRIISERCKNLKYFISYDADLKILLSGADVVITEYSNVGAEAILMDKPLIVVNFIKEKLANEDFEFFLGASIYLEEYMELEKEAYHMLFENKHMEELREGRKKISDQWNIHNDGKATERIFNLLLNKSNQQTIPAK